MLEDFVRKGEITRHIHQVTFEFEGKRLELMYNNGQVTHGSVTMKTGKYHILTPEEREALSPVVAIEIEGKVYY